MGKLTMTYTDGDTRNTVTIDLAKQPVSVEFNRPGTFPLEFEQDIPVSDQIAQDILVTAIEGGSDYWATFTHPYDAEINGYKFGGRVIDREDDGKEYDLGLDRLKLGILKAAEYRGLTVDRFYENHDAIEADIAVQFALFGEIVYG